MSPTDRSDWIAPELLSVAAELQAGQMPQPITVRSFLWWFGVRRRGFTIVGFINDQLSKVGVRTVPDFNGVWIDAPITFELVDTTGPTTTAREASEDAGPPEIVIDRPATDWTMYDPTYRVSRLSAANQQVVAVKPDAPLAEAITLMMAHGYSQLPVMPSDRHVKGVVSWRSIGARVALGAPATHVREVMEPCHEIRMEASIFDAMQAVVANDYVLVRASDSRITGIVTAADLSLQFHDLTEPFLLLSEIENLLRNLIGARFPPADLKAACDPGDTERAAGIERVADLTFGEYIRLLQQPDRWTQLGLMLDRNVFCGRLDEVRKIRNDVMHFDPDGIEPGDLAQLREFTRFLRDLAAIRHRSQN